ncbi:MAG: type II 3-dehydroquinate dehydratase [Hornefia sp.]|nr:type II 3-dehydroquinate dehydratase [Hornefia sp.]
MKVIVINGPNINMLGIREPEVYGNRSYEDLINYIEGAAKALDVQVTYFQSNHEGDIVDEIQKAMGNYDGIVINPAGYTHTSVAILDALKAVGLPAVEVHISDIDSREDFRKISITKGGCIAGVVGKGFDGYVVGIKLLKNHLEV